VGGGVSGGRWYHGTSAQLSPGDVLVPGTEIGVDNWGMGNDWGVWITPNPALAAKYGPHVYAVEPEGEVIDWADENGWDRDENNDEYVCDRARIVAALELVA
jgi:hypothetical protein